MGTVLFRRQRLEPVDQLDRSGWDELVRTGSHESATMVGPRLVSVIHAVVCVVMAYLARFPANSLPGRLAGNLTREIFPAVSHRNQPTLTRKYLLKLALTALNCAGSGARIRFFPLCFPCRQGTGAGCLSRLP